MDMETQTYDSCDLIIPAQLATPNMRRLKSDYGFDTLAERKSCLEIARLAPGSRVLDVGSGTGWMALVAACAGYHVVSVDVDYKALLEAENTVKQCGDTIAARIEFKEASASSLPFEDEQFDGVITFETIHHLPDCEMALAEMCRVTRSGGPIVIADLNERGLKAVRETSLALNTGPHEENSCQLPAIERMLRACAVVERHDLDFVGVFVVRNDAPCRKLDATQHRSRTE
ncbi:MAG: methyltransferase domain-containing protein [Candidatus Paceibacterota bacterium]